MISKEQVKAILTDIRFWIAFFFMIRLIGITNAPLEVGHNWRQALTSMIARNFYEGSANILYPRIDMAGNQSGIIGSEFPFFNYLIYLTSLIFHYSHWYGRLINLIVSSLGIYFFYLLVNRISSKNIAFNATIVLLSSIWFAFSRKTMPDTFSISLVMIGMYCGVIYLLKGARGKLALCFLFITLGMLCKIPAAFLLAALPLLFFMPEIEMGRKITVSLACMFAFLIAGLWYFYWVPYLIETYHYPLYFPKRLAEGWSEIRPLIPDFFRQFYFHALESYVAFAFFLTGIFVVISKRNRNLNLGLLAVTLVFLLFVIKTGAVFPTHNYYVIPFVPVMALIAGYGISKVPVKFRYIILLVLAVEGIGNQQHDFFIRDKECYKLSLEELSDKFISKNDLIVINGGPSPQEIYFAHRKGWTVENGSLTESELLRFKDMGAAFLIIDKTLFDQPISFFPVVNSGINFDIYQLK